MWMCEWGVGRWQASFPNFDYSNHRMLYVRSTQRLNLQTKCRHPSRVSASILFFCAVIISSIQNAVNRTGTVEMDRVMVLSNPFQKRGSNGRHCNVFAPKKHCGTTTFFCDFEGGNMFPCQTPKMALSALHFPKGVPSSRKND